MVIVEYDKCTGCMACFNSCIRNSIVIEYDQLGFARPVIDNSRCIQCYSCIKSCPVLNRVKKNYPLYTFAARHK